MARLRIAACQLNTVVGDLDGNVSRVLGALAEAESLGADLAVFSELAITGYPPEDLLLKPGFVSDNLSALRKVAAETGRCAAVVGFVDAERDLHNAAAVCASGQILGVYHKRLLPNYGVFDEFRYFVPGDVLPVIRLDAGTGEFVDVAVAVCED
ncbi:MAG: nitrilase-related carbon-nitrogen hydrolase, partial [Thermoplasmata archaeon]